MATTTSAIWKNTYYTTSASSVVFRIELDGEKIFSGKAVKYPNSDNLEINIDKVCRNYLESDIAGLLSEMPSTNTTLQHPNAQRTFNLYTGTTSASVHDYRFYNDWSYTDDKPATGSSIVVSNPVNGHYVPGMLKLRTTRTGTSTSSSAATVGSCSTGASLGYDTKVGGRYVLYYLNSYGGWDAFVVEGRGIKKDTLTSYETDQVYKNTTLQFEMNKYVNEIKTSYQLTTHFMKDDESLNLAKNLICSVKVYLQDLEEGWVEPVVITDNNVTYQTYRGNNKRMAQYTVNVELSQSSLRK